MRLKVGDEVIVTAGSSKGVKGKVLKTFRDKNKVIVEGANIVHKHQKSNGQESGGILDVEAPIDASNVMIYDTKAKKPTRVGMKFDEKTGKKTRVCKKSNTELK